MNNGTGKDMMMGDERVSETATTDGSGRAAKRIPVVPARDGELAYWCMDCANDGETGVFATWEHVDADDIEDDFHTAWCDKHLPANAEEVDRG